MAVEADGTGELEIAYVADLAERARKRLPGQDRDKKRIVALVQAMADGAQALEDVVFDVLGSTRIDDATGQQLDLLGAVVGEARGLLNDSDYRRFVRARILANICRGTPDELIAIFALVCEPHVYVEYLPLHPAGYTLQVVRKAWLSERGRRRVRRIMADVRIAGCVTELIEAMPGPDVFEGYDRPGGGAGYDVGLLARVI